jgi:hypothetical protein
MEVGASEYQHQPSLFLFREVLIDVFHKLLPPAEVGNPKRRTLAGNVEAAGLGKFIVA